MKKIIKIFIILVFLVGCGKKEKFLNKHTKQNPIQKHITSKQVSHTISNKPKNETLKYSENIKNSSSNEKKVKNLNKRKKSQINNLPEIVVSENKEKLKSYYNLPHLKEFYKYISSPHSHYKDSPPSFLTHKFNISKMTYEHLRLVRSEILAYNGYLFPDGFLRGYFNHYKWYKPIFKVKDFKVILNSKEKALYDSILAEELKRKKKKYIEKNGLKLYNADLVVNTKQFASVPKKLLEDLKEQNFSIAKTGRAMPFYIYDENAYDYIPHYITTDLYLFILHRYFSRFIESMDKNYFSKQFHKILFDIYKKLDYISTKENKEALDWAKTYLSIELYTLGDTLIIPPQKYKNIFDSETTLIKKEKGNPVFIPNEFVNYKELKPRGHYTKNNDLKKYFKAYKWATLNGIDLNDKKALKGLITLAFIINLDDDIYLRYKEFRSNIDKLAGKENNLTIDDIIPLINSDKLDIVLSNENVNHIRNYLNNLPKERIKTVFGPFYEEEKKKKRVYFLSSTYSISGEIFSRLVHINWKNSKRPFPRSLDIPAVFQNKTAENIIINEYKDTLRWHEYGIRLKKLQNKFSNFDKWNENYSFKALQTALAASEEKEDYPDFMKTDAYNRKELSTTLSSWTQLKHDLVLYHKKPFAAEAGESGGPKPPIHYSYVEPNITFWDTALELVDFLQSFLDKDNTYKNELLSIKTVGRMLRNIAIKEINGEKITKKEYDNLHFIGGIIEKIYLNLIKMLYMSEVPERDKSMALIVDVYSYNDINLNVAIGNADDIYVLVPIEGEYYIARGSVFSYYEFKDKKIYNDDEWQKLVRYKKTPPRPEWIKNLINDYKSLKGVMIYRCPEAPMKRDWVDSFLWKIRRGQ